MKGKVVIMSEEEFEKRIEQGAKLCILDNLILDVEKYMSRHPGGNFLVE